MSKKFPNKHDLIYLASLYSLDAINNWDKKEERFQRVMELTSLLYRDGYQVFSPIIHCHPMSRAYGLPGTFNFWKKIDTTFISHCDWLVILKDEGWERSEGITGEITIAKRLVKPISFITFNSYDKDYQFEKFVENERLLCEV